MGFHKILQKLAPLFPKKVQNKVRTIYYDKILFSLYCLRNKIYYNKKDFFDAVTIDTTTYCNLRCKFCPNSKYTRGLLKNKKNMEINLYKKIIDDLSQLNYRGKILPFFYGEPLSDNRLPDLILYTRKKLPKSKIQVNSNGFLMTISLYKKLIKNGVDIFHVTQYSNKMPPNMKKLFDYLKTRPKKENKISYRKFAEDFALYNRGGNIDIPKKWGKPFCTYPTTFLTIDVDGNVILCCNDYQSSVKFGNLKKETIMEVWEKPFYKKVRRNIRRNIFFLPVCKKCVG